MKINRITVPYHLKKEYGLWHVYNKNGHELCQPLKIKRAGNEVLKKIAHRHDAIVYDEKGNIVEVYLYLKDLDAYTTEYFERLKLLMNLNIVQI